MKFKKIFIYLAIACCNGTGDVLLKRGMDNLGEIHLNHWTHIFNAFVDPWIILGILFLAGFFYSYLTALSWADLTFVLPASAFGYVVTAFLSRFFLHETVSAWRWAGILLITCGVGLVAGGPSLTERHTRNTALGKDAALTKDATLGKDSSLAKDAAISRAKEQHEPA
ncbi:MAG: DMT family transporter [Candidatus Angelobacter sp.]